jgi:hypothetical protein
VRDILQKWEMPKDAFKESTKGESLKGFEHDSKRKIHNGETKIKMGATGQKVVTQTEGRKNRGGTVERQMERNDCWLIHTKWVSVTRKRIMKPEN